MPTLEQLGQAVKAKHPGVYDDIPDLDLAGKVKTRYPGAYDDFSMPGMEKLGGVPPAAGKRPAAPEELQPGEPDNPFLTSPHGFIREGLRRAGHGIEAAAQPGWNAKMGGASEVIKGLGTAAIPAAIPAALANPIGAATGLAVGGATQLGVRHALPLVGASPEASELGGDIAGLAAGGLASRYLLGAISRAIPSASRAGGALADVKATAGENPISVAEPGANALETSEFASRGGQLPKVIRNFVTRTTDPDKPPLTFAEARDFYSNASRLSADEMNRLTPAMKYKVGQFTRSLGESLQNAAEDVGKGEQYKGAMSEYRRAMKLKQFGQDMKEIAKSSLAKGLGTAIGGAAAGYTASKIMGK